MDAADFRRLALSLRGASESAHEGHPDFRVAGKIFAELGPDASWGLVKLTPRQQARFTTAEPACYAPVHGGWGRRGATRVQLAGATADSVRRALALAYRNISTHA